MSTEAARPLAPEDILPGAYVALLHEVCEHALAHGPNCGFSRPQPPVLMRLEWLPDDDEPPMKVAAVCLPFILVTKPCGKGRMLDVRRHSVAALTPRFGRAAFRKLKPRDAVGSDSPKKKRKKKKRKH